MQAIGQKPKPKRAQPTLPDLVAAQAAEHPEIAEPLRALFVGFENRTFLPQLCDVQRFLDRVGVAPGKLKSRTAAAPLLIRALGKLRPDAAREAYGQAEQRQRVLSPRASDNGDSAASQAARDQRNEMMLMFEG